MKRNADTMSDAIAISSPNGHMSKRAKADALKRLSEKLWPGGCTREDILGKGPAQPTEAESLRRHAANLRDLANRGMSTKRFLKEADRAERQAELLDKETDPSEAGQDCLYNER